MQLAGRRTLLILNPLQQLLPLFFSTPSISSTLHSVWAFLSAGSAQIVTAPMPVSTSSSLIITNNQLKCHFACCYNPTSHSTFSCQKYFYLASLPPCWPVVLMICPALPFSCALRASLSPTGGSWRRARTAQAPLHSAARGADHLLKPSPPGQLEIRTPTPHYAESRKKVSSLSTWKPHECTLHCQKILIIL